uniref:Uncharacterized protein n=1 Tax=Spironucleus salmonicida TaxID=348837 RepID=V6LI72_9EUKA|eukprot:EST43411.1 Hypothetical protein SS50377_16870 [Spironucleus salmonicida]
MLSVAQVAQLTAVPHAQAISQLSQHAVQTLSEMKLPFAQTAHFVISVAHIEQLVAEPQVQFMVSPETQAEQVVAVKELPFVQVQQALSALPVQVAHFASQAVQVVGGVSPEGKNASLHSVHTLLTGSLKPLMQLVQVVAAVSQFSHGEAQAVQVQVVSEPSLTATRQKNFASQVVKSSAVHEFDIFIEVEQTDNNEY